MAKEYGLLPSEVRDRATTYDIIVTEAVARWEQKIAEEAKTGIPAAPDLTEEQLKAMVARVKGAK